jgi:hypothetical protein
MSKSRRRSAHWIDTAAFLRVSEAEYAALLKQVVRDVLHPQPGPAPFRRLHELAFARFVLLAASPLGGVCWPGAERQLCGLTFGQVRPLAEPAQPDRYSDYLRVERGGIAYPVFVAPVVQYAALLLVIQRMAVKPTRNRGLSSLVESDLLSPSSPHSTPGSPAQDRYRLRLVARYLRHLTERLDIPGPLTLKSYLNMGRALLAELYDLDVLYALLGGFESMIPEPDQYTSPEFWQAIQRPLQFYR